MLAACSVSRYINIYHSIYFCIDTSPRTKWITPAATTLAQPPDERMPAKFIVSGRCSVSAALNDCLWKIFPGPKGSDHRKASHERTACLGQVVSATESLSIYWFDVAPKQVNRKDRNSTVLAFPLVQNRAGHTGQPSGSPPNVQRCLLSFEA